MNRATRIDPLPTPEQIRRLVELIIVPELADQQLKALTKLLTAVTNPECEQQFELSEIALRHLFSFTVAHEDAFRTLVGYPVAFPSPPETIELNREL
jgi:hypothetical protein